MNRGPPNPACYKDFKGKKFDFNGEREGRNKGKTNTRQKKVATFLSRQE